jgi:hypothetical protein
MHTQITSKLVTLTAALVMNSLIMAGIALLFDGRNWPVGSGIWG